MTEFPDEETSSAMIQAIAGPREEVTLQQCEACKHCPLCKGAHMVSASVNAAYRAQQAKEGAR